MQLQDSSRGLRQAFQTAALRGSNSASMSCSAPLHSRHRSLIGLQRQRRPFRCGLLDCKKLLYKQTGSSSVSRASSSLAASHRCIVDLYPFDLITPYRDCPMKQAHSEQNSRFYALVQHVTVLDTWVDAHNAAFRAMKLSACSFWCPTAQAQEEADLLR